MAHANDHAKPEEFVKVSGGLLLLYGFGTMIGPVLGAVLMGRMRPESLFLATALAHALLAGYTLLRISRRAPVPVADREAFKTLPADRGGHAGSAAARSAHAEAGIDRGSDRYGRAKPCWPMPSQQSPTGPGATCSKSCGGGRKRWDNWHRGCRYRRPAVSQHLRVLLDAGLVNARSDGTRRVYAVSTAGFLGLNIWLDQFWES